MEKYDENFWYGRLPDSLIQEELTRQNVTIPRDLDELGRARLLYLTLRDKYRSGTIPDLLPQTREVLEKADIILVETVPCQAQTKKTVGEGTFGEVKLVETPLGL